MLSKLDLKLGFHQIMLNEENRLITTFVTHCGVFRYKRLMFGLSSGPEKYQKVISDALKNCVGVANIADDIIVYGKRQKEHDRHLDTVMCMQNVCGLTLNKKPCQFCLSKLTFFGHEFSIRGIDASEEKLAAIQAARPPQNARKARSFMGLVQYSEKFIPDLVSIRRPILDSSRKAPNFTGARTRE